MQFQLQPWSTFFGGKVSLILATDDSLANDARAIHPTEEERREGQVERLGGRIVLNRSLSFPLGYRRAASGDSGAERFRVVKNT